MNASPACFFQSISQRALKLGGLILSIFLVVACDSNDNSLSRDSSRITNYVVECSAEASWIDIRSGMSPGFEDSRDHPKVRAGVFYDPIFMPQYTEHEFKKNPTWEFEENRNRTWKLYLHAWRFADYWLLTPKSPEREKGLLETKRVAIDYIRDVWNNRDSYKDKIVVYPMVVANRAAVISYLLCQDNLRQNIWLNASDRNVFETALYEHVDLVIKPESRSYSNHGLMASLHMYMVGGFFGGDLAKLQERYVGEFHETLTKYQLTPQGMHKEHTTTYMSVWYRYANMGISVFGSDQLAGVEKLMTNMKQTLWWFLRPDGTQVRFGDIRADKPFEYIEAPEKRSHPFIWFKDGGYAIYKSQGHYLNVAAAYHKNQPNRSGWRSASHKHRDDMTFSWAEGEANIIEDTGFYGYKFDWRRLLAVSKAAHNSVIFGKDEMFDAKTDRVSEYFSEYTPYGEAIDTASIETLGGQDAFIVTAHDPLAQTFGRRHNRQFIYRPGKWLLIVDTVQSKDEAMSTFLHFAPGWTVANKQQGTQKSLSLDDVIQLTNDHGNTVCVSFVSPAVTTDALTAYHGHRNPDVGWSFGPDWERPRTTLLRELQKRDEKTSFATFLEFAQRGAACGARIELKSNNNLSIEAFQNMSYQIDVFRAFSQDIKQK